MKKIIKKTSRAKGKKFAVVVSRFNDFITKNLLTGCLKEFSRQGVKDSDVIVVWVPGAWEIPLVALKLAKKKNIAAVACLGCVIRGETAHFDFVARGACDGIQQVALSTGKPVVLGVLTTETVRQAEARSKLKGNNKGQEAAEAALDMVEALNKI
ncbi:MAG: 6,7-dimethyl-8-ribityllumazine synthase [Candidatus Aceula meridiana]|nr:6,7-dimethyl-8-ribityllumazine synthase [Candidatus Aceula meridiana]